MKKEEKNRKNTIENKSYLTKKQKEIMEENILTVEQASEFLKCSPATAREIFHRNDFPAQYYGKEYFVTISALLEYCNTRHVRTDE